MTETIDSTLSHLDLRKLRLGTDDPEPAPHQDLEDAEEAELLLDADEEYTTPWQLPAEV